MPVQNKPIIHGRDHGPDGADPIKFPAGAGSYTDWVLALTDTFGYWPLQEASGDAQDLGPLDADCQPVGTPAYRVSGPNDGDLQYAVRLTGAHQNTITDDSFHNTADQLDMDTRTAMTAMCWIKPLAGSTIGDDLPIIGTWDVFRTGWILAVNRTTRQLIWNNGNGTSSDFVLGPVIPEGAWTFVAATIASPDGVKLYVDGSQVAAGTAGPFVGAPTGHGIRIGAIDYANVDPDAMHFYGDLAGAVWINRALTAGEIQGAYDASTGEGGGGVVIVGPGGDLEIGQPGTPVEHGDGDPEENPQEGPGIWTGTPTSAGGWHYQAHFEYVVLYDSSPGRFDVPPRKWTRVPFNTIRIQRTWELTVDGNYKTAWLEDDRGLTENAKNGTLLVTAGMTFSGEQEVSGWFSIEYPMLDFERLPNQPSTGFDHYTRAARMTNVTHGSVLRRGGGYAPVWRSFLEWPFLDPYESTPITWQVDNPYPIYPHWSGRPLNKPLPYPKLSNAASLSNYKTPIAELPGFDLDNLIAVGDFAAGDNLSLQAWQDSPWLLRFGTDKYPPYTPYNYTEQWRKRPCLVFSHGYDPETINHTTGAVL